MAEANSDEIAKQPDPTPEQVAQADALRAQGNNCFKSENYVEAIRLYTEAIALDPTNYVLSNILQASFQNNCSSDVLWK